MHELLTHTTTRVVDGIVMTYVYKLELFNGDYFGRVDVYTEHYDDAICGYDVHVNNATRAIQCSLQFDYRGYFNSNALSLKYINHARATLRKMIANNA